MWGLKDQFSLEVNMTLCSTINSTRARNKQSIFVLLSHHQKCTLIGENTGLYFSWIVDKNSKNTSQFQLVAGSPIHLLDDFSLWRIHGEQWITFLWHFWYYLTVAVVSNGSKYFLHRRPLALWKPTWSGKHTNILIVISGANTTSWLWPMQNN